MKAEFFVVDNNNGKLSSKQVDKLNTLLNRKDIIIQHIRYGFQAVHKEEIDLEQHGIMIIYEEKSK